MLAASPFPSLPANSEFHQRHYQPQDLDLSQMTNLDRAQKDFSATMRELSRGGMRRNWTVFRDFCEMAYCATAKPAQPPDRGEALEARYMRAIEPYSREDLDGFARMLAFVRMGVEGYNDVLGSVCEIEGFCDVKYMGQAFTPDNLAEMIAMITFGELDDDLLPPVITLAEPCCGSGRLIFAACRILERDLSEGSVPTRLWVDATDLDIQCAQMTYIQMALAGVPGVVRRMNTISMEQFDWAITPHGVVLYATSPTLRDKLAHEPAEVPAKSGMGRPTQGSLFDA